MGISGLLAVHPRLQVTRSELRAQALAGPLLAPTLTRIGRQTRTSHAAAASRTADGRPQKTRGEQNVGGRAVTWSREQDAWLLAAHRQLVAATSVSQVFSRPVAILVL